MICYPSVLTESHFVKETTDTDYLISLNIFKRNDTILKTMIKSNVDVLENDIKRNYPEVLEALLFDQTTGKNIFWATDNYKNLGKGYEYKSPILPELITGIHGTVILPRAKKSKAIQQSRIRDMGEVFTPSWVCNAQNNLIDNAWFEYENAFNTEVTDPKGNKSWKVNSNKIMFPQGKTWKQYVKENRLEISFCLSD